MIQHENKARRHHHTCVTNVMLALREPHAVPRWGGCMHDGACTLSTTSTPCAYLHTQSCLVSPPPEDLLLAVWITKSELPFSRPHVWAISVDSTSPPSASLRRRGRDLRVSGVWCYSLKGQSEICELKSHPKNCVGPYVDPSVCVWPGILYILRGSGSFECVVRAGSRLTKRNVIERV